METLKYATFQFTNYHRIYTYLISKEIPLEVGRQYHIETATDNYHTPVHFMGYVDHAPKDIPLKEVVVAEGVE